MLASICVASSRLFGVADVVFVTFFAGVTFFFVAAAEAAAPVPVALLFDCAVGQNNQKYRMMYWVTHSSVCLSVHSFARTDHSFASSEQLALLARSTALTHSLASSLRSLRRSWDSG